MMTSETVTDIQMYICIPEIKFYRQCRQDDFFGRFRTILFPERESYISHIEYPVRGLCIICRIIGRARTVYLLNI